MLSCELVTNFSTQVTSLLQTPDQSLLFTGPLSTQIMRNRFRLDIAHPGEGILLQKLSELTEILF